MVLRLYVIGTFSSISTIDEKVPKDQVESYYRCEFSVNNQNAKVIFIFKARGDELFSLLDFSQLDSLDLFNHIIVHFSFQTI